MHEKNKIFGHDIHKAFCINCELHEPWDSGLLALGRGQYRHIWKIY